MYASIMINLKNHEEAKEVLDEISHIAKIYGYVTLADIYDLCSIHYTKDDTLVHHMIWDIKNIEVNAATLIIKGKYTKKTTIVSTEKDEQ